MKHLASQLFLGFSNYFFVAVVITSWRRAVPTQSYLSANWR